MQQEHVDAGRAIQRRTGKTFYLATRFLPERVRHPTYVLYGFFRTADEIVDDPGDRSPEEQRDQLAKLRSQALGREATDDPVLTAFRTVRERHDIPDGEVDAFVDAMRTDVDTDRYDTEAELETYMRGSAAAVGTMMTAIMSPEDETAALPHAIALGKAFQLTNFLRDVREDVLERDRIYLPRETLRAHDVSTDEVAELAYSDRFASAMADLLEWTETLYREGVAGIRHLPRDCQFPVVLASVLYAEHHALVRDREYDVLSTRPTLSTRRKLWCVARTRWHWQWNPDPETVFRRVSAVPTVDPGRERDGSERERGPTETGGVPTR